MAITITSVQSTTSMDGTAPRIVHKLADIGQMARGQRKDQGLRIDDAAALIGVSVDLLSRLENGKGSVGLEKVLSVLDGLGLCLVVAPRSHPSLQTLFRAECTEAKL
jgi:transcriptional regulator with XRE-family HTH domain